MVEKLGQCTRHERDFELMSLYMSFGEHSNICGLALANSRTGPVAQHAKYMILHTRTMNCIPGSSQQDRETHDWPEHHEVRASGLHFRAVSPPIAEFLLP